VSAITGETPIRPPRSRAAGAANLGARPGNPRTASRPDLVQSKVPLARHRSDSLKQASQRPSAREYRLRRAWPIPVKRSPRAHALVVVEQDRRAQRLGGARQRLLDQTLALGGDRVAFGVVGARDKVSPSESPSLTRRPAAGFQPLERHRRARVVGRWSSATRVPVGIDLMRRTMRLRNARVMSWLVPSPSRR
jgi:hypothetical protein